MKNKFINIGFCFLLSFNLQAKQKSIPELYKKLLPTVVTLHTYKNKVSKNQIQVVHTPNGLGSGVIISDQGLIVTASHVVHIVDGLQVEFSNGERVKAKVVSSLPWADLALVKVEKISNISHVAKLGESNKTEIGERVFVIGAPLGLNRTLTVGYISGKHPVGSRKTAPMAEFFQTDAAINPGNSGGPLFNMSGNIIGIASHIQTQSGGSQGLGFTVTSETVKQLLLNRGRFWSGIEFLPLNAQMSNLFQLPQSNAVLIQRVANGSIGQKMGLQGGTIKSVIEGKPVLLGGDIVLSINGNSFDSKQSIVNIMDSIKSIKSGKELEIVVWRLGKKQKIKYLVTQ